MTTPIQTQAVTVRPKREIRVVEDDSALSYLFDTAKFEHCYRIAEAMSKASLIPNHLKGNTSEETAANCFLVVNQALRWHMDPFAVAPETYSVGGKLGYQGKLVAAVVNTRAGLAEKLSYEFSGKRGTDEFMVTVSGRFEGEDEPKTVTVSVGQARTSNQMWTKDPEQKLVYTGSIRWARRHAPEIIMGVTTDDDLDAMRTEAEIIAMKPAKKPKFDGPAPLQIAAPAPEPAKAPETTSESTKPIHKRPTMVEEPLEAPKPTAQPETPPVVPQTPNQAPVASPGTAETPDKTIMRLATEAGISKEQLVAYMKAERWMKKEQSAISEMSIMKLTGFLDVWKAEPARMIEKVKGAKT